MSDNVASFPVADDHDYDEERAENNAGGYGAAAKEEPRDVGGVAGKRLQAFIERVERLEAEKAALAEDIKEVYAEAKGVGFDVKVIRKIISLRKIDVEKRREAEELLELYKSAIGMI